MPMKLRTTKKINRTEMKGPTMKRYTLLTTMLLTWGLSGCGSGNSDVNNITDDEFTSEATTDSLNMATSEVDDAVTSLASSSTTALGGDSRSIGLFKKSFRRGDGTCPTVEREVSGNTVKITRTYDNCSPGKRLRLKAHTYNGSEVIERTRNDDDDDDLEIDRSRKVKRDLTISGVFDFEKKIKADNEFTLKGTFPNITFTGKIDTSRKFTNPQGKEVRDYDVDADWTVVSSGSGSEITQIVKNGSRVIKDSVKDREIKLTFKDVTWTEDADCDHPVSGSIEREVKKAGVVVKSDTITFDGTCGEAKSDDDDDSSESEIELPEPE